MPTETTNWNVGSPASRSTKAETADLVRRCIDGDNDAHRELFRQQARAVHATLFRILGRNHHIEDLIQETFIETFRSLPSFRGEAALSTWIGRITTRVAFAHIRKRKRRIEITDIESAKEPVAHDSPAETLGSRRALAALYDILAKLDPKQQIAYALHVIDGKPLAEVAALTNASVTATKTRVWRARKDVNRRAKRDPNLARYLADQGVAE